MFFVFLGVILDYKSGPEQRKRDYDPSGQTTRVPARVKLSAAQRLFCEEYLLSADPRQSALAAGLPAEHGYNLLSNRGCADYISYLRQRRATRLDVSAEHVLRVWLSAWRVDYNEFSELRIGSCRYCWGIGHHYQFVDLAEAERTARAHALSEKNLKDKDKTPFDDEGGEGFDPYRTPMRGPSWYNADVEIGRLTLEEAARLANSDHNCTRCFGKGEKNVILKDTRYLSPGARYLYEGLEIGDRGQIKIKLVSRDTIAQNVARAMGMKEGRGARKNLEEMSENELDEFLAANNVTVDHVEFERRDDEDESEAGADQSGDRAEESSSEDAPEEGMGSIPRLGE